MQKDARESAESKIQKRFVAVRNKDYTTMASRAAVYTAAILRYKMLVGDSQTLSDLHRSGAGCAMESLNSISGKFVDLREMQSGL